MTTRILPPDEWSKLAGTEAEQVWPLLDPVTTHIVVVEREDVIVGCQILTWYLHAECLWIAPADRGHASVGRRLWTAVQRVARAWGSSSVITGAVDDRVRGLLAHVGAMQLPGDQYVVPVRG